MSVNLNPPNVLTARNQNAGTVLYTMITPVTYVT